MSHPEFLTRALACIANGYRIIPVKAGEKRPGLKDWETSHATEAQARKWAVNGFANGNIGIITANHPAVDLDIYDESMAHAMEAWLVERFGDVMIRVGQFPKRLAVFRTSQPFTKMFAQFSDPSGKKHKVEILGDGQQFVAYGIHPDTQRPFEWMTIDEPVDTPAANLIELTVDHAREVLAKYTELARAAGWKFIGGSEGRQVAEAVDDTDALATFKPTLKLSMKEIADALEYTDQAEDYERWIMVGMALHHQSKGQRKGLEVWQDWSSQADNYSGDACEEKWKSFSENSGKRMPVTFASVLKIANERRTVVKAEEHTKALNILRTSTSEEEIFGPIAKLLVESVTAEYQLDIIAKKMQDRVFEITDVRPRIETVRKALAAAKGRGDLVDATTRPAWAQGWVYLKNSDKFYHVDSKSELTEKGFNAQFDRMLLTDEDRLMGNSAPAARAATMALNLYNMPTVDQKVYLPGMDKLVELNGRMCVNTFDESSVPAAKAPESDEEHRAIAIMEAHFANLLRDPLERNQVLDYLSYNVQFPAEKIVWAIVMQGVEGGGKTTILKLLARVMGPQNVGPVSATELQDKYTSWAESKKMVFIEEIRLHGANRYEILDKLKPYISNEDANVRRMHKDSYEIPNVTNYFMFTNYWDALPLSGEDRRYYVVATWFQTKKQLKKWEDQHPDYFSDIYAAIRDHADVLRWWLLNRKISDTFQAKRPALDSQAKTQMRELSDHSEEADALADALEGSDDIEISDRLLNVDALKAKMEFMGVTVPYGKAMGSLLSKAGFHLLGRFRVDAGSTATPTRFYTRETDLFPKGHELETIRAIRAGTFQGDDGDPFA
jgi:hypothetical protein